MKILYLFILVNILCCSVKQHDLVTYKGDLAVKLIVALESSYVQVNEKGDTIFNVLDHIKYSDGINQEEEYLIKYIEALEEYELTDLPLIKVNFDPSTDAMVSVFLEPKEYEKIKHISHVDLEKEDMKLKLEFTGTEVAFGMIKLHEILSFEKVPGKTIIIK